MPIRMRLVLGIYPILEKMAKPLLAVPLFDGLPNFNFSQIPDKCQHSAERDFSKWQRPTHLTEEFSKAEAAAISALWSWFFFDIKIWSQLGTFGKFEG
jgi:hypothetical protein